MGETRGNLPLLASRAAALENTQSYVDDRGDDGNDDVLANHGDNYLDD